MAKFLSASPLNTSNRPSAANLPQSYVIHFLVNDLKFCNSHLVSHGASGVTRYPEGVPYGAALVFDDVHDLLVTFVNSSQVMSTNAVSFWLSAVCLFWSGCFGRLQFLLLPRQRLFQTVSFNG